MVKFYDPKRSISKKKLAEFAEVCPRAFAYYLESRREVLATLGVTPNTRTLKPPAVRYVCEDYCIDLPPEYQDQRALAKAPKFLRDLIFKSHTESTETTES